MYVCMISSVEIRHWLYFWINLGISDWVCKSGYLKVQSKSTITTLPNTACHTQKHNKDDGPLNPYIAAVFITATMQNPPTKLMGNLCQPPLCTRLPGVEYLYFVIVIRHLLALQCPRWLFRCAAASCLPVPPPLVRLLFEPPAACCIPLGAPPLPLVAPPSLVHLMHDSCLCHSLEPPPLVVSASHRQPAPHVASALHLHLSHPPIISRCLSSLAGRLIVTLLWPLLLLSSCCCPPLHQPLHQGPTSSGFCPHI